MHRRQRTRSLVLAVLGVSTSVTAVHGQVTNTWIGAAGDNLWTTGGNWTATNPPGSSDTALFSGAPTAGSTSISLSGTTQTIGAIQFAGGTSYDVGIASGDTLNIGTNSISSIMTGTTTYSNGATVPVNATDGAIDVPTGTSTNAEIDANIAFTNVDPFITNSSSNSLILGSSSSLGVMTIANGSTLILQPQNYGTIALNDSMQVSGGGTGTLLVTTGTTGTVGFNSAGSNYSGSTILAGGVNDTYLVNASTDTDSSSTYTKGPFGTSTIYFANSQSANFEPIGGTRTLANPIGLINGMTVLNVAGDTSGLNLNGPISDLSTASLDISNNLAVGGVLTFGSAAKPSTITLSGTSGATLSLSTGTITGTSIGNSWVINDVIQNGAVANGVYINGKGSITLNGQSTYTGGTSLTGQGTVIQIPISSNALPGSGFTSGPFGAGAILVNNTTNQHLRPIGPQTISNAINMQTGFAMDNAPGDSTSNLTFAGAITEITNSKFISNGFTGNTGGASMILGAASTPSTITIFNTGTLALGAIAGPIVVNDVIQNPSGGIGTLSLNPNTPQDANTITLSAQNTYSGGTSLTSGSVGYGTILVNADAVGTPGAITSGPFGTGTIYSNSPNTPGVLSPMGADRTVPNAFDLTNAGFWAANSATAPYNLTLTGTITLASTGQIITNQMVSGSALTLGSSAAPTAITDPSSLTFQTQLATGTGGTTVINDPISGAGYVVAQSNAVVNLQGANSYTGGTTVQSGAVLTTNTNLSNGTLTLTAGTTSFGGMATVMAQPTAGATAGVTSVPALSIDSLSKLDITNNGLIVQSNTPFSTIQGYIKSGSANNYTGNGITSSLVAADAVNASVIHKTAIGYATVAELGNPSTFLGVSITDSNSTLVRFTLAGDSDLSGQVTSSDFADLAANYGQTMVGGNPVDWFDGDYNGDGTVNALDFNALATNYGLSVPVSAALPDTALPDAALSDSTAFDVAAMAPAASLGTLVPEPTTLSLVGLSLLALRRRRAARSM